MRMYLIVTTYTADAPIYRLYKTHTAANLFDVCYAERNTEYVSFNDMEIYIEELEVEG